jgi:hypothetical protein
MVVDTLVRLVNLKLCQLSLHFCNTRVLNCLKGSDQVRIYSHSSTVLLFPQRYCKLWFFQNRALINQLTSIS